MSVGLLPDDGVGFQPQQHPFIVIILRAAQLSPAWTECAEHVVGDGRVFKRPPPSAFGVHQAGDSAGQLGHIIVCRGQPTAHLQHFAQILRQTFINPKEGRALRGVEIGGDHRGGPAILPTPRMHELVGQQHGDPAPALLVVDQVAFAHAVQA